MSLKQFLSQKGIPHRILSSILPSRDPEAGGRWLQFEPICDKWSQHADRRLIQGIIHHAGEATCLHCPTHRFYLCDSTVDRHPYHCYMGVICLKCSLLHCQGNKFPQLLRGPWQEFNELRGEVFWFQRFLERQAEALSEWFARQDAHSKVATSPFR